MFLPFREEVEDALSAALSRLDLPADDLGVEEPPENVDAVLASSVAFRLAEVAGSPPPAVAAQLADEIDLAEADYVAEAAALGPYVNFTPSAAYYRDSLAAADDDEYGRLADRGESVVVEHTSANPTGPIHVGRARNTILGDALARVLDYAGYDVERHYYVNDAGRQIAVFTWAYETFDEEALPEPKRAKADYEMVRYYRAGNEFLENADPESVDEAESEIRAIIRGLEERDPETYERVGAVVNTVLDGMRQTLDRLPATFDEFVKETRFIRNGATATIVDRLKDSEHAVYEEAAWQLDLEEWDIENRFVFLRSDGTTLYTTRDLAHHEWKFERFDRAVTVLGEDQRLHAQQLSAALDILGNDTDRLTNVFYSWVNLPEGGMSTRRGTGVDMDDLLDEAIARARTEVETRIDDRIRGDELEAADVERIARQVGIGAVRYDIVSKQPSKTITFRWEDALDFEAQSAPYVQYAHARACGILDAADEDPAAGDATVLTDPAERALLRQVARFPAVVESAAAELEPHQVATFARSFADAFNTFYRECPVLKEGVDPEVRAARLALVRAARHTLGGALGVLGIEAPESM